MITSIKGIELIKHFESLHDGDLKVIGLQPKMCPAGYWTEGWGRLILDEKGNKLEGIANKAKAYGFSKIHNEVDAEIALKEDLEVRESMINSLKLKLNQVQFDALVSFCYNIGFANLKTSTLLKEILVNPGQKDIANQFKKWIYSKKVIMPGLIKRREAEAILYFSNTK